MIGLWERVGQKGCILLPSDDGGVCVGNWAILIKEILSLPRNAYCSSVDQEIEGRR